MPTPSLVIPPDSPTPGSTGSTGSALDPRVQAALDALQAAISGKPGPGGGLSVQDAYAALVAALGAGPYVPPQPVPTPTPAPGPTQVAGWWKPSDNATAAFAARIGWSVADLLGARQAIGGSNYFPENGLIGATQDPAIAPYDGTEEDAKLYNAFGFRANGTRAIGFPGELRLRGDWKHEREAAWYIIDLLHAAPDAPAAEHIYTGAGGPGVTEDLAIACLLTNHVDLGGGLNPRLVTQDWQTVADMAAYDTKIVPPVPYNPNGPGPSGR
jgi:hypothetical protein